MQPDFKKCVTESCTNLLSRKDFQPFQSLEASVQREVDFRRRVRQVYNKSRHDFDSDEAFDNYLEEIEDKVFRFQSKDTSKQEKAELYKQILADERALK